MRKRDLSVVELQRVIGRHGDIQPMAVERREGVVHVLQKEVRVRQRAHRNPNLTEVEQELNGGVVPAKNVSGRRSKEKP